MISNDVAVKFLALPYLIKRQGNYFPNISSNIYNSKDENADYLKNC